MTRWIVVGGGAAGSVVAARLSADESNQVVLIEAGADHGSQAPGADRGPFFDDPERVVSHLVRRRAGGAAEPYLLGSGLGGSSLINGSIVVAEGPGGTGGHDLPLERPTTIGRLGAALLSVDARAERLLLTTRNGERVTAADAYLRPVLDRPNLTVVTRSEVDRVLLDGNRAVGVHTRDGRSHGGDRIVLTAGAIGTPVALLRSGVSTEGIGRHLQDHPAIAVSLRYAAVADDRSAHDITVARTTSDHQVIALERTSGDATHGALVVGLTRTTSRGSIGLDDDGAPVISLQQLGTSADRDRMTRAVLDLIELADRPSIRALAEEYFVDDRGTRLDEVGRDPASVAAWVPDRLTGFHHVAGTCRRGEVTDEDGWVRGYEHLAVADASLFVDLPPVNPYLSTIVQAEQLVGRWRRAGL